MPLTIDQLQNVYDGGIDQKGLENVPQPPKAKPVHINDFLSNVSNTPIAQSQVKGGGVSSVNVEPYKGYNTEGVFGNRDFNAVRGEAQSAWDKWGNFLLRTTAKVGTGLVEGLGYAGALVSEWRDDKDYSNGLTELAKGWNQSLDENLPIYRTTNNMWGNGTDLGWWLENAEGLVSSVASFALEGAGLAKAIGYVGKVSKLAEGAELLSGGARLGNATAELMTAGGLAYTEGAQMGKGVFDTVYNTQLQKALQEGKAPDEAHEIAKHIAAQSAATTVQLNTMINTGLNLYSVIPFFNHEERVIEDIARKNFFMKEGESIGDWAKRLPTETIDKFKREAFKGEGKVAMIREAASEGIEELTNQFAEKTGLEEGKEGKTHGLFDQLGQLSKYFDRTMDSEGALNFVMGAIAGPMTNVVTTNIPIHKVQTGYYQNAKGEYVDKEGNLIPDDKDPMAQYKLMSSRAKNKFGNTNYFNNIRDAVMEDVKYFQDKHSALEKFKAEGKIVEAEQVRNELFNVQNKRAVQLGFADNLKQTYKQIGSLDNEKIEKEDLKPKIDELQQKFDAGETSVEPELNKLKEQYEKTPDQTQAMRMGFASDLSDKAYKAKAEEAIKDLDELQKIHEKVMAKFGRDTHTVDERTNQDPLQVHLSDFVFDRYANLHLMKKQAKQWQKRIDELQSQQQVLDNVIDGTALHNYQNQIKEYTRMTNRYSNATGLLASDFDVLDRAEKSPNPDVVSTAMDVLEKYGAIGVNAQDAPKAIKDTKTKINTRIENMNAKISQTADTLLNSSGYQEWVEKHPGKSFDDYRKGIIDKHALSEEESQLHSNLEYLNERVAVQSENLDEILNQRTLSRLTKKTQNWWNDLAKERKAFVDAQATEVKRRKDAKTESDKMDLLRMKVLRNKYASDLEGIKQSIETTKQQIEGLRDKMRKFETNGSVLLDTNKKQKQYNQFNVDVTALSRELVTLQKRMAVLQSLYNQVNKDVNNAETNTEPETKEVVKEDSPEEQQRLEDERYQDELFQDAVDDLGLNNANPLIPFDTYVEAAKSLHPDVQQMLKGIEQQLRAGEQEFSYDALETFVDMGLVSQGEAARVLQLLNELMQSEQQQFEDVSKLDDKADQLLAEPVPDFKDETPGMYIDNNNIVSYDSLVTDNSENGLAGLDTNRQLETNDRTFVGKKSITAASNLAGMDLEYTEDFNEIKNEYFKEGSVNVNQTTHQSVFNPKGLLPGTKLRIVIDDTYDGSKNNHHKLEMDDFGERVLGKDKFEDYIDTDGKIMLDDKSIGNLPIKLVNEKNETVRYLHTNDWVNARYDATSGPEGYRNVYDGQEDDPRGILPGNVQRQSAILMELRRRLVAKYNRGEVDGVLTTVQHKGAGVPILNWEHSPNFGEKGKVNWDRASNLLPDKMLTLAIKQGKDFMVDTNGVTTDKNIVTKLPDYLDNRAIFLLPGLNGDYHAAVTKGINLMSNNVALNTITKAIEVHLSGNDDTKIKEKTGFDLTSVDGLRGFINQYFTHTQNLNDFKTVQTEKLLMALDIIPALDTEFNNRIVIGMNGPMGYGEKVAELENGKLSEEFKDTLKDLLSKRLKNVVFTKPGLNIRGINDTSTLKFQEVKADKDGKISFTEHDSYNEYIKNHLLVNVNGTNTTKIKERGREKEMYVYAVNPQIQIDIDTVLNEPKVSDKVDTTIPHPTTKPSVDTDDIFEALSAISDNRLEVSNAVTGEGKEVTLNSLQELANLAAENRNGKTITEVYNYLTSNGITTLYDGHNPFINCK